MGEDRKMKEIVEMNKKEKEGRKEVVVRMEEMKVEGEQ